MLHLVFHDGSILALSPQQPLTLGRGRPASWQNPYISRAHAKLQVITSSVDQINGSGRGGDGGSSSAAATEAGASRAGAGAVGTGQQQLQQHGVSTTSTAGGGDSAIHPGGVVEVRATGQNKEYGMLVEQQQSQGEPCVIPQLGLRNVRPCCYLFDLPHVCECPLLLTRSSSANPIVAFRWIHGCHTCHCALLAPVPCSPRPSNRSRQQQHHNHRRRCIRRRRRQRHRRRGLLLVSCPCA